MDWTSTDRLMFDGLLSGWVNRSDTIAAMGKMDADISEIMHISLPTLRFHVTNATRKLNVIGRPHAIYKAATLGYVGRIAES